MSQGAGVQGGVAYVCLVVVVVPRAIVLKILGSTIIPSQNSPSGPPPTIMLSFTFLFLPLALWPVVTRQAGFSSPYYVTAYGHGGFMSNVVWYVGDTKEVVYNISGVDGLSNYTIALWQQSLHGASAMKGPVIESKWFI